MGFYEKQKKKQYIVWLMGVEGKLSGQAQNILRQARLGQI